MGKRSTRSNKENDSATANKFDALAQEGSSDDESEDEFPDASDLSDVDFKKWMMKHLKDHGRTIQEHGRTIQEHGRIIQELVENDVQMSRAIQELVENDVQMSQRIKKLEDDNMLRDTVTTCGEIAIIVDRTHTNATLTKYRELAKEAEEYKTKKHGTVDSLYKVSNLKSYNSILKVAKIQNSDVYNFGDIRNVETMIHVCRDISGDRKPENHKMTADALSNAKAMAKDHIDKSNNLTSK